MSLYPFLHGLQERLGLSDTPTPDDVLPYYRTSEGCWKDFEVQFPPDKRPHVYVLLAEGREKEPNIMMILIFSENYNSCAELSLWSLLSNNQATATAFIGAGLLASA